MYRCYACGRRLTKPAYTAPASMGGWMLGPICAGKSSALPGVPPKPRAVPRARVLPAHAGKTRRKRAARAKTQRHAARVRARRLVARVLPGQMTLDFNHSTKDFQ